MRGFERDWAEKTLRAELAKLAGQTYDQLISLQAKPTSKVITSPSGNQYYFLLSASVSGEAFNDCLEVEGNISLQEGRGISEFVTGGLELAPDSEWDGSGVHVHHGSVQSQWFLMVGIYGAILLLSVSAAVSIYYWFMD